MKHYVGLIVILCLTAVAHLSILRAYANASAGLSQTGTLDIPDRIGEYVKQGADAEIEEHVKQVLGTSMILIRNYVAPPQRNVELTLVHSTSRRSLHFPEVCLVGGGWEIQTQTTHPVGFFFNAKKVVLVNGEMRQLVLYWFKTGDELTGNFFVNAYHWAKTQLSFGSPKSTMIKVSTVLRPGQSEERAFETLEDFALKFTPILQERVP
ncbi:MAG: EpsI family protein [Candidatus Hydrogenedentes bacterium]|nr:EpsI family protein [Candidatus Hydrogenedentota bacterium]